LQATVLGRWQKAVFEAEGGIHELNEESVNTIFRNIGKVPKDPKWGKGPPLEQKEKKVLKERLHRPGSWHSYVISQCPRNLSIPGNFINVSYVKKN
jgi:hypothetical protein